MPVDIVSAPETRSLWPAIRHGAACRCPSCGQGKLFRSYLKVNDHCAACGEALHHHKADDLPPYIAIVIVGHLLIGAMLHLEMSTQVNPLVYLWVMVPLALFLPLAMLPSIKGAVVGLQWANLMHGFGTSGRDPADPDEI